MKEKAPLISVLVCNYNYARYINETLASITDQSYPNIEIIIVDDGSQDDSSKVIKDFIENNELMSVTFVDKAKNEGLCIARNDALDLAKGEYIIFLDSDDTIPSDYLSTFYSVALKHKADVVYGDIKNFGDSSGKVIFPVYSSGELLLHNYINISSLVKRSSIKGHRFDVSLNRKTLEDYDFWLGLSLMGLKFVKATESYLNYRIQAESRNENTASLETRILNFIDIWEYSITKYRQLYPGLVPASIEMDELRYQIKEMGFVERDLHDLNDVVNLELKPELARRGEHIEHLQKHISNLETMNRQLQDSIEYKIASILYRPVKTIKRVLKK